MAMFKQFYGFSMNPFDKTIGENDAFISHDHKEAVSRLDYLKTIHGIGVITAGAGMGKSFALRCFAKKLNPSLFQVAYICLCTVNVTEFYQQLCHVLQIEPSFRKSQMFLNILERLYHLYKEKRTPLVLMIDEAQELSAPILKDLKMIMNHAYDSLNCFSLVLCGEPHLNYILQKQIHEALRQRISVHYNYEGLGSSETAAYIAHKFALAGAAESILGEGVLTAVTGYTSGNPRLIDSIMVEALTLGAQQHMATINTETIMSATNNLALV
jgi:type II secretory pathway predicted ATPase ExeA